MIIYYCQPCRNETASQQDSEAAHGKADIMNCKLSNW